MTKNKQIQEERRIIQSLLAHLKRKDDEIDYSYEKTESPDFKLKIGEKTVGCELTRITLEELEAWVRGWSDEPKKFHQEIVNLRADKWMHELLERKVKKTKTYWKNCGCEELWLVVHFGIMPLFGHNEAGFDKMKQAIKQWPHDFDKIWFVGQDSDIRQLWPL